jgi:AMP nucleosidase
MPPAASFETHSPEQALARVREIYARNTARVRDAFQHFAAGGEPRARVRACYPFVRVTTRRHATLTDSRLAYGFVAGPGVWATTLTRPDLYGAYLLEQFELLVRNHDVPLEIGESGLPIPVHFAFPDAIHLEGDLDSDRLPSLSEWFDLPDLSVMDDSIVNGTWQPAPGEPGPLALFTAPRIDYSLHRLRHYTGTTPEQFQHYVLFTNYQFYIDEFVKMGRQMMETTDDPTLRAERCRYTAFVEPGDRVTRNGNLGTSLNPGPTLPRLPQMPAYHLQCEDRGGITMINIGVGPSNAKTITDHVAVLRPHAWLMLGHCAGLRNTQRLGDYVLAHGYVREDHVLDADLPPWVPVPALAEVQQALEKAVAKVTALTGYELKRILRTGTVATVDDRNWELRSQRDSVHRLSQTRAVALDMESATIAANGFRFRVPYGTLLCVSDKPLHGQIKLPGMADRFYRDRVDQHLEIGVQALNHLRDNTRDRLHSRKLRSFAEVAFQ